LEPRFPKWWLMDVVEFVEEVHKTSVGESKKSELRERFAQRVPAGG
jgi:acyl-CoA synthetase (AMP-forming)/AMP-acid ligase II